MERETYRLDYVFRRFHHWFTYITHGDSSHIHVFHQYQARALKCLAKGQSQEKTQNI